jgi:Cft2 family RNA processing exonuclease
MGNFCLNPITELHRIEQPMISGRHTRTISSALNPSVHEAKKPMVATMTMTSSNPYNFRDVSRQVTQVMEVPVRPAVPRRKKAKIIPFEAGLMNPKHGR